ncbi:hypothetical protein STCU_10265 [Strigomonas culicis]|uniref:Uncharacterized protein n=1 Tax=Strigomonas culicis TaxID=28005 RepID=S9TMK2_9TRYP|nr:hypothetical protein STCU_10265 [Strigomonas culicis]|eukprot:EPY17999.1 hypothetical protein STCU_10265 [Strigomonas culicis]
MRVNPLFCIFYLLFFFMGGVLSCFFFSFFNFENEFYYYLHSLLCSTTAFCLFFFFISPFSMLTRWVFLFHNSNRKRKMYAHVWIITSEKERGKQKETNDYVKCIEYLIRILFFFGLLRSLNLIQ